MFGQRIHWKCLNAMDGSAFGAVRFTFAIEASRYRRLETERGWQASTC